MKNTVQTAASKLLSDDHLQMEILGADSVVNHRGKESRRENEGNAEDMSENRINRRFGRNEDRIADHDDGFAGWLPFPDRSQTHLHHTKLNSSAKPGCWTSKRKGK
jgi:hypothetical protein